MQMRVLCFHLLALFFYRYYVPQYMAVSAVISAQSPAIGRLSLSNAC